MTTLTEYIENWSVVNRSIDIENEFQQYKPFHGFERTMYRKICEAEIAIGKTQAADVAPVQHGRWIVDGVYVVCAVCNRITLSPIVKMLPTFKFCPNCGAKMYEEEGSKRMSEKQEKKRRYNQRLEYITDFNKWLDVEPSILRPIAWHRWKKSRPIIKEDK